MRIKQQKDIKKFLIGQFGEQKGKDYFEMSQKLLENLISGISGRTKNQTKMLSQTILPRIALYKTLVKVEKNEKIACETVQKYMIDVVAENNYRKYHRMEQIPAFFNLFKKVFLKIMKNTDLQKSTQVEGKDYFDITITCCLWHDACVENDCPTLCKLFCDVDDIQYGKLDKMGFTRTQTLGYGGNCCDFHFYKK